MLVTEQPQQPSFSYTDTKCLYSQKIWFYQHNIKKYRVYDIMTQYISLPAVTVLGVGKFTKKNESGGIIEELVYHVISRYNP